MIQEAHSLFLLQISKRRLISKGGHNQVADEGLELGHYTGLPVPSSYSEVMLILDKYCQKVLFPPKLYLSYYHEDSVFLDL